MPKPLPHRLLVEGKEETHVIPQLMEKFIPWGEWNEREKWPAEIASFDGIEPMLKPGVIEAELKSPGLKAMGILVDANSDPKGRWKRIRDRVHGSIPTLPDEMPISGLIVQNVEGLRFGVWMMPDNVSQGMLETFLRLFIPDQSDRLFASVKEFCEEAKSQHQAPYRDAHLDKALIHAWLSVQDPPGQQLHSAIIQNILRPSSPHADAFVRWFRELFQV